MSNKNIQVGGYGWLQPHWKMVFYPADMPAEWCLSYYSNEFNTVMVPGDYWRESTGFDCEQWLDDIHEDFRFYVECPAAVLSDEEMFELFLRQLAFLSAHLAGVWLPDNLVKQADLANLPRITDKTRLFCRADVPALALAAVWQAGLPNHEGRAELAIFEDDLSQLRQTRVAVENFIEKNVSSKQQAIIVKHETLSAANLMKFRSVIEIMGL